MRWCNRVSRCVFFSCYANHRDLHSFPTRRSSDLRLEQQVDALVLEQPSGEEQRRGRASGPGGAAHRGALQDRKSTRLNSSHSQISYAVFCLKKKKKKKHNKYRLHTPSHSISKQPR